MVGAIRVLIVDDSAVVRQVLAQELRKVEGIEVVGTATDPYVARDLIIQLKPDVLTLDIEMPRMDGLSFLKRIMAYHPLPVVVLSSLAASGTQVALDALEHGAVEVVAKPSGDLQSSLTNMVQKLTLAIRAAAQCKLIPKTHAPAIPRPEKSKVPFSTTDHVIVIGASTGGTEAVRNILAKLPADSPGILVVLHMPEMFTARYAERLNQLCAMEVREARDDDPIRRGLALVAQGDHHLSVVRSGGHYVTRVSKGPLVCGHRPSVEVLFQSAAQAAGVNALGIILTGMGSDGAKGMRAMRDAGSWTIAQNEDTCVVFGMPKEAIAEGGACEVLPLDHIANACKEPWKNKPKPNKP